MRKRLPRKRLIISRKQAIIAGTKKYFTGKPCKKGHISSRYTLCGNCLLCIPKNAHLLAHVIAWREANKDNRHTQERARYAANPEKVLAPKRMERRTNPDKFRVRNRTKYVNDVNYRLAVVLRSRLKTALRDNNKKGSAVRDLGCSLDYLRYYLEYQFSRDMTWNNSGSYWEIDHITPLFWFDLTDRDQLLDACHYTNLQPLAKEEHKRKTASQKAGPPSGWLPPCQRR